MCKIISLLFVILVYVFNILFANSFWYSFLPGMNLHLFKYLGNGFMFEDAATTVLHNVLITPIQSTMNFLYSALINVAYSMIAIAVSYTVFRRRDF